jgi:hypothetical protein
MTQRPRVSDVRKAPPVGVKLKAALLALGFTWAEINGKGAIIWDHRPPLSQRKWSATKNDFDPPQHDPRYLAPMRKSDSDSKTWGLGGSKRITTRGSDVSEPKRLDGIAAKHAAFRKRVLSPKKRVVKAKKAVGKKAMLRWPKRKLRGGRFTSDKK